MKTMTFLAAFAAVAAHAGIALSPEHPVSPTNIVDRGGSRPAIAAAGPDALVAWCDTNGVVDSVITSPGVIFPKPSRRIRVAAGARNLSIVWTGRVYILAWIEGTDAVAAAAARDGVLLTQPHVIASGVGTNGAIPMAWDGANALLLLGSSGFLLDGDTNLVRANIPIADLGQRPSVVATSAGFVIASFVTRNIGAATSPPPPTTDVTIRMTHLGDTQSVDVAVTDSVIGSIGVAFDGHRIALSLLGVTLHRWVVDPATFRATALPDALAIGFDSNVVWSGSAFVSFWSTYGSGSYRISTLPFTGSEPPAINTLLNADGNAPDLVAAPAGTNLYLAWTETSSFGSVANAMVMALDASGTQRMNEPFRAASELQAQADAALAPGLAAWIDVGPDGRTGDVYASRLDDSGAAIGTPIRLSTSDAASAPRVVSTGSVWLVVWNETAIDLRPHVKSRRIARDGALLDALAIDHGDSSMRGSMAFNGTTVVMPINSYVDDALIAERFDRDGNPLDGVTMAPGASAYRASAATNGSDFLIAFTSGIDNWQFAPAGLVDVYGARLSASGTLLDPQPIAIAVGSADQTSPAVASDGRDYLVSYFEASNSVVGAQLKVQRVSAGGFLDGSTTVVATVPEAGSANIDGDASGYWLTWGSEVARLDTSGAVIDGGTIAAGINGSADIVAHGAFADVAFARSDDASSTLRAFTRRLGVSRPHGRTAGH